MTDTLESIAAFARACSGCPELHLAKDFDEIAVRLEALAQQQAGVPEQADERMLEAGEDVILRRFYLDLDGPRDADFLRDAVARVWEDMLAAAPQPPAAADDGGVRNG